MRLSEDRIAAIAQKVAFQLKKKRLVNPFMSVDLIQARIERPMLAHFQLEEKIDEEVRTVLSRSDDCPPEGSYEYQALFIKRKEEIAARHNYEF